MSKLTFSKKKWFYLFKENSQHLYNLSTTDRTDQNYSQVLTQLVCPQGRTTHTASTLSEAQFLLLFVFLANHFHVAVLPHALPQFDGTTANILP